MARNRPTISVGVTPGVTPAIPASPAESLRRSPRAEHISRRLAEWWRNLSPWGKANKCNYFSPNEMTTVSNSFPCPDNEHTIRSYVRHDTRINGSKISLGKEIYQIGQSPLIRAGSSNSPEVENYSNAIAYGLECAQGLVQIVSDTTHGSTTTKKTLAGMLQAELQKHTLKHPSGVPIKHVGWEHFAALDLVLRDIKEIVQPGGHVDPNFRQYRLTLWDPLRKRYITMPLTQIGMPFKNTTLKADDIIRASEIVSINHEKLRESCFGPSGQAMDPCGRKLPDNQGPLILSKFGHGRSATIVTFQAVSKMIRAGEILSHEKALDALMDAIEIGRASRPHFVHSRAQVEELHKALNKEVDKYFKQLDQRFNHNPGPVSIAVDMVRSFKAAGIPLVDDDRAFLHPQFFMLPDF